MSRRSTRLASATTTTTALVKKRAASETMTSSSIQSKETIQSGSEETMDGYESRVNKSKKARKATTVVMEEKTTISGDGRPRCKWAANPTHVLDQAYHDTEWAVEGGFDRTNRHLFEMLILEGAQAGLSWRTILAKRNSYREAYANFDYIKINDTFKSPAANERLMQANIVKNRLKVEASLLNARLFRELLEELYPDQAKPEDQEGFWQYLQQFKIGAAKAKKLKLQETRRRRENAVSSSEDDGLSQQEEEEARQELTTMTTRSLESDRLSAALKKRGFKFVGTTICYTYLMATGVVEDLALAHFADCFRHPSNA